MLNDERISGVHAGFACVLILHPKFGIWTGYVAVPAGHPWHGRDADDVRVRGVEITYSAAAWQRISPDQAQPTDWVFGFDSGHLGDEGCETDTERAKLRCEILATAAALAATTATQTAGVLS